MKKMGVRLSIRSILNSTFEVKGISDEFGVYIVKQLDVCVYVYSQKVP